MKENLVQIKQTPPTLPTDSCPAYIPPRITTYTSHELIELIGPAQACSPNPSCPTDG